MTADNNAAVNSPAGSGDSATPLSQLKRLGKYQIEKKIGAGGMGTVFLARDTELKRTVALKVLPRDKAANPILVRRFRAEAQAAAQLRHPNIVAVFDSGEADGFLYIAMEYVEGRDLFEMVALRGVVPARRSIEIIRQVASALQHAYEQNIVHRDIKPSNLLIRRDGVVKLTDLGLARSVDDTLETNITRAGTTVGTVDYMAPEQARNSKLADIRSDLYSLGCTWYQMLTGVPPYPEGAVTNKLQAHAVKPIPDPRDKNPRVPEGLTAVIRRLMAKKPEDRYQTPAELIEDLDQAKLTEAAISREIFSDLSDYDQSTDLAAAEEAPSDDGYFDHDDERTAQETPDLVETPVRRRPRATGTSEPAETARSADKSKPRPATPERQEQPPESRRGARPTTSREPAPAEADSEPDPAARRQKPRTVRPDEQESPASPTAAASRPAESKPRPKAAGQKTLPPKRQPLSDSSGTPEPFLNKELLTYLTAVGGLVLVIVGLGWLISSYSGNVAEIGPPPETLQEPVVDTAPVAGHPDDAAKPGDPTTVVVATAPTNGKTDSAVPLFDVDKIPGWAIGEAPVAGLTVLTVGTAPPSPTNFATLEAALLAAPPEGAVVRLQGAGPFPLPLVQIAKSKRVVISGENPQTRPVIALVPAEGQAAAGMTLRDGLLELRGLHFSIDRQVVSGPLNAVEVVDGQLIVQNCSFTASGDAAAPAVAMVVQSSTDAATVPRIESRLLVDRVLVRGGLSGVAVRRANVDAVVRDSLMVTGIAPAIEASGHVAAGVTDVITARPRRILRFQRCTLSSQTRIFDLSVGETGKPPQTAIVLHDSICTALGTAPNSAIATAAGWPQVRSSTDSWLSRMTWSSTNTLYLGFAELIDLGASFKVVDTATWQRVWNSKADNRQFQKLSFPETMLDDLSVVLPQEFDARGLSYHEVKAADGGMPGCPVGKLTAPDVTSQQRAVAITSRPTLPAAALKPAEPAQVRKVDLRKEDLGTLLSRNDWPSGTQFEATGSGICQMTPAKIDGKSLRIVFRQADGVAMRLQPAPPSAADSAKPAPAALISITQGTLELSNASLEKSSNPKTPEWLVQATDATVILNACRLQGAETEARQGGLLQWITTAARADESPALVVRDCYLAGSGSGIRADCARGPIILRNSILAVRGDALDLRPGRTGNALLPVLDAEDLTISATGAAIRFEAAPGTNPVQVPMRLFVERCVFAPPVAFKPGEAANATVLQCAGPVFEQHQLEWWGASNGVARQVPHLVRRDGDSGPPVDDRTGLAAWRKLWSKGSNLRLLTGDKGVYLTGELPNRWRDLKPLSFKLHQGSQGATWAEGGRPIGANTQAVEDITVAKKGASPNPVKPNGQTKKNVGF